MPFNTKADPGIRMILYTKERYLKCYVLSNIFTAYSDQVKKNKSVNQSIRYLTIKAYSLYELTFLIIQSSGKNTLFVFGQIYIQFLQVKVFSFHLLFRVGKSS